MKVKYLVCQFEITAGDLRTIKEETFDTIQGAIDFREKQKDGFRSWWEIVVDYTLET